MTLKTFENKPSETNCVRVWWGFRRQDQTQQFFLDSLGQIFIPTTVQQMGQYGLRAYHPALLPSHHASYVPDEVALIFYKSVDLYKFSTEVVPGREYQMLHRALFNFDGETASSSDFPEPFNPTTKPIDAGRPYYLFQGAAADWMVGTTKFICGEPLTGQEGDSFLSHMTGLVGMIAWSTEGRPRPDAAIFRASERCFTYWEHWAPDTVPTDENLDLFEDVHLVMQGTSREIEVPANPEARGTEVAVRFGVSYNCLFAPK